MDLKSIQEKLNSEFKGAERKLVFWYDDHAEFADEVDSIVLDNAKVYKLTPDNWFYTKYFFEMVDKTTNYLVYAPFPKPADRDNHLADTVYYSKLFYADKISLIMLDLKIPEKLKEYLKKYPKFFNYNKYTGPLAALGIENYSEEAIDIGILSVLTGVKTSNFDEVLRTLIISGEYEDNKYIENFKRIGVLPAFWQLCQKYYGYAEEKPTLEKLVITMLITYTAHSFNGELPKAWQYFISPRRNDIAVFVNNLMNNMLYKERYDEIAESIAVKIKAAEYMKNYPVESFWNCDTFEIFDIRITEYLTDLISTNNTALPDTFMLNVFRSKTHFYAKYARYYFAIDRANMLLKYAGYFADADKSKDIAGLLKSYTEEWMYIDRFYREFYYAYDRAEPTEGMQRVCQLVENVYTNVYLSKLSMYWADKLEACKTPAELPKLKQYDFYRTVVAPMVKKECTVVIISDAFRYECATELHDRFGQTVNHTSELDYMISTVPAYTRLGMAALLPHKEIAFTDSYDVLVDGQPCVTTEQRQKILEAYRPASVVATYNEIMAMSREEVRKLLTGKELVYIYHNQIDARGDNASTENEVFVACYESLEEISRLVKKLTVDKSITNYIITSDHGFIYKRDKLDESDKVTLPKAKDIYLNKRFILSREPIEAEGTLHYSMDYLGGNNAGVYVAVPRGADIFKASGGGQNYVHGGAALQEMVVPVIKLKTGRYKQDTGYVSVTLVSLSRKITNLITYLDFMQNENVSDTVLPVVLKTYFINETGEKVSNENIIYADRRNEPPEKRMFKEKFTFRNRKYSKNEKYYLVLIDDKTDVELGRYEFLIDIAFADDFGFGV